MIDRRVLGIAPRRPSALSRLGAVAPVPFVGVAAIMVALIIFTPLLLASGPSPLAVQGYLYVYRPSGSLVATDFEVTAYDQEVPYGWINLSIGSGFHWNGGCPTPTSELNWTYQNETDELVGNLVTNANPVVVNATAVYVASGTRTVYAAEFSFDVAGLGTSGESLDYAPCPWTPGVASPGSWMVSRGTLGLSLVDFGSGGPP